MATTLQPPYLAVWIAHPVPTPDGLAFEHWRPLAAWAINASGAHELARQWRRAFPGALLAVRPEAMGPPLLADGMPDYYDLPPYADA